MSRQELGRSMLTGYLLWEVDGGTGLSTRNTLFIARAAACAVYGYAHPLTNARFATHCSPRTAPDGTTGMNNYTLRVEARIHELNSIKSGGIPGAHRMITHEH